MANQVHILVFDNGTGFASLLTERLEQYGYTVNTATNYNETFNGLEEAPCHVAVLDMNMPGLGGLQQIKVLRATFPGVKVIMLTDDNPKETMDCLRAGAFDYQTKPVHVDILTAVIRNAAEPVPLYGKKPPCRIS
ncbi:response regulator [Pseudodesulfovibrio sediminis]|uniref:Response regulatory domain-containing protein n=1 Tax=Pseudodesulfovibrio sediminis TaxID=2810563 RepID=A0ABN6EWA3_9BACT|nr:response regulator [Pseudodesulfovibrio sediminis]BCS89745.1 hypothetical protein PSDVSF_29870 [Pseudodesulfovibrio sediminis]